MSDNSIGRTVRAWIWGIIIGGAAGFTVGLLTAPHAGRRMRRRVAYQLETVGDRVTAWVDDMTGSTEAGEARLAGDALVADAEDKAQQIREDIDTLIGEMRQHRKAG